MFRRCALRVLAPPALRASNGQRPGRECIFPFRTVPQFSMVVPLRSQARLWHSLLHWAYSALFRAQRARFVRPSPSAGRCSGTAAALWAWSRASSRFAAFDCALRFAPCALGTSALRAFTFLQAFASTVRNRRSASLASSLAALVAHWAHYALFRSQSARFVRPTKNARNDVHAVISDLSLVLPILCQCSDIMKGAVKKAKVFFTAPWWTGEQALP